MRFPDSAYQKVAAPTGPKLNFDPLPHQEQVADKLDDESGQLIYHGLGTGKTKSIVNAAHQHNLPLIAIVPAALRNNMRKEIQTSGFKHPAQVLSYEEALKRLKDPDFREQASNSLVAFDEAHRAASEISQRKTLFEDLPAKKKLLATATPARNHPSELAPLINAIEPGSLPDTQREFNKKYVETRKTPQSFMGWFTGQKPEVTHHPKNMEDFNQAIKGKVDFYHAADRTHFPSSDESTIEVPMAPKQQAAYNMVMGKYPMLWYKIKHGLPPSKSDEADFKAFMSGPRQVMNHPGPYNSSATDADAPKIKAAVDEIETRRAKDKNFRGVTYSAYLGSGIHPLSRELTSRNIPHAMFTGDQTEDERKHIVESYNKGKLPVLLISGAGSEGLDLKGTKLMQIMEPHWNEELIDQVRGRAIRYKSHDALPEDERHVEVQRFHSVPAPSWVDSMLGRHRGSDQSADEYLYNHAQKKRELLAPFLNAMQGKAASTSQPAVIPCPEKQLVPGLLVDLDDTLVRTRGRYGPDATGRQEVLPGRLEALKAFKDKGYKIVAITNRSTKYIPLLPLLQVNQETMGLFEGLLDDLICCPEYSEEVHKPAPTMLLYAMHKHNLNPANLLMVGDSENDQGAAEAANVHYVHPSVFFSTDWTKMPEATPENLSDPYGATRWVCDPSGNFVGALACCGQDAVAALKERIEEEATKRNLPVPRTIACEEGLSVIIPSTNEDFAAWVDSIYDECLPPVE